MRKCAKLKKKAIFSGKILHMSEKMCTFAADFLQ